MERRKKKADELELTCPSHSEPHSVSGFGFILLEKMEAALKTTEQSIRSVVGVYNMCSYLRFFYNENIFVF